MPTVVEAAVLEARRTHPSWGPRRIVIELGRRAVTTSKSAVYRCLHRAGLVERDGRRRRRREWKRWEHGRPNELWQMDVVGGFLIGDSSRAQGVDGPPAWAPAEGHPTALVPEIAVWRAASGIHPQDPRPPERPTRDAPGALETPLRPGYCSCNQHASRCKGRSGKQHTAHLDAGPTTGNGRTETPTAPERAVRARPIAT
jgi:hypothetical protein